MEEGGYGQNSLGLQRALTPSNIHTGFRSTSIWPLNLGMVEKYLGPARPFERAEVEATDGNAPGCGDLRRSCEKTLPHLSGQVRQSSEAARNCSDVGGFAAASEPFDGGDNVEGPDEALVALLQGRVPERQCGRQHFVVRGAEVSTALGRRSLSPSQGPVATPRGCRVPELGLEISRTGMQLHRAEAHFWAPAKSADSRLLHDADAGRRWSTIPRVYYSQVSST